MPLPTHRAAGLLALALALALSPFACSKPEPSDELIVSPGAASPSGQLGTTTGPSPSAAVGGRAQCEDFGALAATALKGTLTLRTPPIQAATMTLPSRPVTTKARIVAAGTPASLIGRTAILGTGENASVASCTHCLILAVGCTTPACTEAAWFFPRAGTATLTKLASTSGQAFEGVFNDVELEQVKVAPDTNETTAVPGGACIRVSRLTFSASVVGHATTTDAGVFDAEASDAGAGDAGAGDDASPPPVNDSGGGTGKPEEPQGAPGPNAAARTIDWNGAF